MAKKRKNPIRKKGKISLSEYFKSLKEGDVVSITKEKNLKASLPERIKGKVGVIKEKRGKYFIVCVKEGSKMKEHIIHAINLRRKR